jgi:hypothetical protein
MRIVEELPSAVCEIETLWIPLADGTRLAARVWMPEDAEQAPVPAIIEYIPYRKRDFTRRRDEPMHHYFAGHGYAAVRVDVRGSGDSDGLLDDEYTQQEHDDALETIAWIAAQPWCTGKVGLMGISWGGFNALQIAALRPPALAAIMTLCSTDDRYADDAHYMGGCVLNENLQWGSVLLNFCAYPPDPQVVGDRWRDMWMARLENAPLFPALWLQHQRRDDYWRHGSVCEDYGAIECPVYAIGGWADGYSNAVPRLLRGLAAPHKGLIGPWSHAFPHDSIPGPSIGFLQEAVRWWDHWLKGIDSGIMAEPIYRVWMQDSVVPCPTHVTRPGRWVAEEQWPSRSIESRRYAINAGGLGSEPLRSEPILCSSLQTTGVCSGDWCAFGTEGELPTDQRSDDEVSLTFDSPPLDTELEILGAPVIELEVEVNRPNALLAVRLNDVAPDGSSLRVTYGVLNLAHRGGHAQPEPVEVGGRWSIRVQLNDIAHRFPSAHVLRLAISTSYWPLAWPSPEPATVTVFPGSGWLEIPVRHASPGDGQLRDFGLPEQAPQADDVELHPGRFRRTFERDLATDETVHTVYSDDAEQSGASLAHIKAIGLDLGAWFLRRYRITERDPLTATAEIEQKTLFRRPDWEIRIETRVKMSATRETFVVEGTLRAFEGDVCVFDRKWNERVPRDCV